MTTYTNPTIVVAADYASAVGHDLTALLREVASKLGYSTVMHVTVLPCPPEQVEVNILGEVLAYPEGVVPCEFYMGVPRRAQRTTAGSTARRILRLVGAHPDGMTVAELQQMLDGVNPSTVAVTVSRMKAGGQLHATTRRGRHEVLTLP